MLAPAAVAEGFVPDLQGLQALRARATANDPGALRAAARQFEALLLETLLKEVRQGGLGAADDPYYGGETMGLYRELMHQQWVQRMVQGRGLGLAERLVAQMERSLPPAPPDPGHGAHTQPAVEGAPDHEAQVARMGSMATQPQGEGRPAPTTPRDRFLERMRPYAEQAARATGLPTRFILAHAALESGWGMREIRGEGGRPSHNLFGIKAGPGWKGESVLAQTTEYRHGVPVRQIERFRAYADYAEAFADYAGLLQRRYAEALRSGSDARAFAQALAAGGYATDPAYAGKLAAVIASVDRRT